MPKVKSYGLSYGDVTDPTTGALLRVQDCYGHSGRLIAIRPGFAPCEGYEGRVWNGISFPPEMLGQLILLLQAAMRFHSELLADDVLCRLMEDKEGGGHG